MTAGTTQQAPVREAAAAGSRIASAFARCRSEGRAALIPFITAGYPDLETSGRLLRALVAGGADLIEIGVPFSDPLADGATIQRTSQIALANGTTVRDCFSLAEGLGADGIDTPIVFMGYANPFFQYGLERLAADAERFGVDGFIVPDLPIEESEEFLAPLRSRGRDLIFLLAPTSTDTRIQQVAERASGFIYCVSLTGVTGARSNLADDLAGYISRVRSRTDLPLAIGFGISTPDHVRHAVALADGAVVASALIDHLDGLADDEIERGATEFVRGLVAATAKATPEGGKGRA